MTLSNIKATTSGIWLLAMCAAGLLVGLNSPSGWLVLAGCAIVPPLMMMRYWNHPAETTSQSIQRILR